MARNGGKQDGDMSLAVRAAWLHYAGALTQGEVAARLGITSVKAHRLIMRANQDGVVKVVIDGDIAECVELEAQLSARYGLRYCEVVPDLGEEPLPLRALGIAGARLLAREIEAGGDKRNTVFSARDVVTTAGASADVAGALNTMPGTTRNGEEGRLFVRGGAAGETGANRAATKTK